MKALVKYDQKPGMTKIMDMPIPRIGPDDVLIKVQYAGICGTDPHIHHSKASMRINTPLILGHEFAGIIKKAGKNVTGLCTGELVTAETHARYCGICTLCRNGMYHLCRDRMGYGFQTDGAFAEFVCAHKRIVHKIPEGVSPEEASLTEPLCVAYSALVKSARVRPGDTVAVIGPGPIGMLCAKMAKIQGASRVFMIGTTGDEKRLETSLGYGADEVFTAGGKDVEEKLKRYGDGYGVDIVVDTAGAAQALDLSLNIVRPGGMIVKIGWGPEPVGFSLDRLIAKAVTLKGHFSHTWDVWEKCLSLMSEGIISLKPLMTHILLLDDWEKGFRLVEEKEAVKAVLKIY